jgi:hypothetical protein
VSTENYLRINIFVSCPIPPVDGAGSGGGKETAWSKGIPVFLATRENFHYGLPRLMNDGSEVRF